MVVHLLFAVTQAAAEDRDVASSRAKHMPKLIKPQRPTRGPTADRAGSRVWIFFEERLSTQWSDTGLLYIALVLALSPATGRFHPSQRIVASHVEVEL